MDPSAMLDQVNYYAQVACNAVHQNVPYVMPENMDIATPLGTIPVPLHSLPWVGSSLPVPGTDLKALHSTCREVKQVGSANLTKGAISMIHQSCRIAATYLYERTPTDQKTAFQEYRALLGQSLQVDPSHLIGTHVLRLWHE